MNVFVFFFFVCLLVSVEKQVNCFAIDIHPCWNWATRFLTGNNKLFDTTDMTSIQKQYVVVGDLHGSLKPFLEILFEAKITETSTACEWNTAFDERTVHKVLIQTGDVVDRGPNATETWNCLGHLQLTAPQNSKVVRLIGNHDLFWLEGAYHDSNKLTDTLEKRRKLTETIRDDIAEGRVLGSHFEVISGISVLFVHAGLRHEMKEFIEKQPSYGKLFTSDLSSSSDHNNHNNSNSNNGDGVGGDSLGSNTAVMPSSVSTVPPHLQAEAISTFINAETRRIMTKCKESNQIPCPIMGQLYAAGPDRGGDRIGGPFWTDFRVLREEDTQYGRIQPMPFIQVVGHTIQAKRRITPTIDGFSAIGIDVGIYQGGYAFLAIDGRNGSFYAHEKPPLSRDRNGVWSRRDLTDEVCSRFTP